MRFDPEAASIVLHEPWKKITEVPIDPTTRTFFKPEFIREVAKGQRRSMPISASSASRIRCGTNSRSQCGSDPSIVTAPRFFAWMSIPASPQVTAVR